MHRGFVNLWRCSTDSMVWNNEGLWKVWCWCLMKASYLERWKKVQTGKGFTDVHLLPGQFVFGRKSAAKALQMEPSNIRNRMEKLRKAGNIEIKTDTHFSIVTICNWDIYQSKEIETGQAKGQAKDRQRTGKGHKQERIIKGNNGKEENTTKGDFNIVAYRPSFIPENLWEPFIDNRKFKKLQNSEAALRAICGKLKEAVDAGWSIDDCIGAYVSSNWQRFDVSWMENQRSAHVNGRGQKPQRQESQKAKDARELVEEMRGMENGKDGAKAIAN